MNCLIIGGGGGAYRLYIIFQGYSPVKTIARLVRGYNYLLLIVVNIIILKFELMSWLKKRPCQNRLIQN